MNIGTAEPLAEPEIPSGKASGVRSSSGGGNSGGGGNGGDDGDGPEGKRIWREQPVPDKAKVVTWFLLLIVFMTFGGLIGAYIVLATNRAAEWNPFELPLPVWISTVLIIVSSFVYHRAKIAVDRGDWASARRWFTATTVFGAAFIASQMLAWLMLVKQGLYMSGNPYAGLFYILTGIHAVHVLGGMIALGTILLRSWVDTENEREVIYRRQLARSVGWYWHFMGILWIGLFLLLGFWK